MTLIELKFSTPSGGLTGTSVIFGVGGSVKLRFVVTTEPWLLKKNACNLQASKSVLYWNFYDVAAFSAAPENIPSNHANTVLNFCIVALKKFDIIQIMRTTRILVKCKVDYLLIIFGDFARLVAGVLGDNAPLAEKWRFNELVELLAPVRRFASPRERIHWGVKFCDKDNGTATQG